MLYFLYRLATILLTPLLPLIVRRRLGKGKEWPERYQERFGLATIDRPAGPLIWFHCASIGESKSIQPLVRLLTDTNPDLQVLITSGTVTSARLLQQSLDNRRCMHQFPPLDSPVYVSRFLDHWQPDMAIFVESEIWPNLLNHSHRKNIPVLLMNGRMSERSFQSWRKYPATAKQILGHFSSILCQSPVDQDRFAQLSDTAVQNIGNLKYDQAAPVANKYMLEDCQQRLAGRPIWLLASSHKGEERVAAAIHHHIKQQLPDLLTIIMPRHPERATEILHDLSGDDLRIARRSLDQVPDNDTDIWLADTLGESGLWMRLASVTLMGGSISPIGGHNFIEPALCDSALVSGPHIENFLDLTDRLVQANGLKVTDDPDNLPAIIGDLLVNAEEQTALCQAAKDVALSGRGATRRAYTAMHECLPNKIAGLPNADKPAL